MTQEKPGLYQAIFDQTTAKLQRVQPIPLPEVAFLSKALQMNLPGLVVQLHLKPTAVNAFLKAPAKEQQMVRYQPTFPFKALRVTNGQPTSDKVIGAQVDYLDKLRPTEN